MRTYTIPAAFATLLIAACNGDDPADRHSTKGHSDGQVKVAQADTARDAWQQPAVLFEVMGGREGTVKGRKVADLFAGDGYMTFKLVEAGANVISISTDPQAVAAIEDRKRELGLGDDRLQVRLVQEGETGLSPEEADIALCMHKVGTLPDLAGYFLRVRQGLKSPKMVCIVDFLPSPSPMGPPMEQRFSETQLMDLLEPAGFTDVGSYGKKLPYQYLMIAQDFVPGPDTPEEVMQSLQTQ